MSHWRARIVCAAVLCLIAASAAAQPECPNPVIVQISGANPSCASQPITLDAGSGWTAYLWSNGATTRTITDSPTGTTAYSVTTTDAAGCSKASVPYQVSVYSTPMPPTLTISPATVCSTGTAHIDSNPSGWGWSAGTVWSLTNATITRQDNQSVDFTATGAGPVTVNVTAMDPNGCPGSASATAQVRPSPTAVLHLMMLESCPGSMNSAYIDPPDPQNPYNNWANVVWSVTGGAINNQSNYSVNFTTNASGQPATVTAVATDSYGCTNTATVNVAVRSIPPPVLHLMMLESCPGSYNSAYIDPPDPQNPYNNWSNVVWSVTGGAINNQSNYSVNFTTNASGQPATVTAVATDSYGCTNTATVNVGVRSIPPPVLHLMMLESCPGSYNSAYIDPPDPQNPYNSWSNVVWSVTNGAINNQSNYSVNFTTNANSQPATVTAVATDSYGCTNTATINVAVRSIPPPVLHLMMLESCPGTYNSAYIDPPDPQNPYNSWSNVQWSVTNAPINSQSNYSVNFTTNSSGLPVTVTAVATDGYGCTNTATISVPVRSIAAPEISVQSPDVCPTSEVYATVAPPDGYWQWQSYSWSATNARITSMNTTSSSIFAMANGDGPVTLTATLTDSYGCSVTSTKVVPLTSNPPTAVFSGPQTVCAGARFSVTATDPNYSGRYYSFASPNAALHSIEGCCVGVFDAGAAGTTIDIYVTSANSGNARCESWGHTTVTVVNPPTATITPSGPTTLCPGGSVTLTAGAGANWLWSNGATTQSIVVSNSGSYTVTVGNAGCSATSAPLTVTMTTPATPTITASGPTTFCAGGSVTLTASAGAGYTWSNGATTQSIVVSTGGSYSVTVRDANGCNASSAPTVVTVNTALTPSITPSGPTTFCAGGSVTLTASAGASYAWSSGATTQSITVNAGGSYSVTVTGANGCSAASSATVVTVNTAPAAAITASGPTTFCAGGSVTLTASAGASYAWSNGATTQSIAVNASGSYSVTVTGANGCSASSAATAVTVNALPTPSITAGGPTTFCRGGSVTLTATPGASYQWTTGAVTQSISVSMSGNYKVYVTNANGCGAFSNIIAVTVNEPPAAPTITMDAPQTWCDGGPPITLTSSPAASYLWSTGATTRSVSFSQAGSYNVTVTVSDANGCRATAQPRLFRISNRPPTTITASGPTTFCAPGAVNLTAPIPESVMFDPNTDGPYTYLWSTGATTSSIHVTQSGSYSVTVTNYWGCSATSAPTVVTANDPPKPTITADGPTLLCTTSQTVTLRASDGAASYRWYTGEQTQSITVSRGGIFRVVATYANGCERTSDPFTVNEDTLWIQPSGPTTFCNGTVTLYAQGNAASYSWSNGATTSSITVSASGTYTVTATFPDGCTMSKSQAITSSADLSVSANPPRTVGPGGYDVTKYICPGAPMRYTAQVSGGRPPYTYQWYRGNLTLLPGETGPTYDTTEQSMWFSVVVTDAGGCVRSSNLTQEFAYSNSGVGVWALDAMPFCPGGSTRLSASFSSTTEGVYPVSYSWSTGATTQQISVSTAGSYSVTVTDTLGCTSVSQPFVVSLHTPPDATITANGPTTFCPGGAVTLTVTPSMSYRWSTGATTQSITVSSSGNYSVTVTDGHGCSTVSAPTAVTVRPAPLAILSVDVAACAGVERVADAFLAVDGTYDPAATFVWSITNGTLTSVNGSHATFVSNSGPVTLTVTGRDHNGCSASKTKTIDVFSTAVPTITAGGPTTFCAGGSVNLTASPASSYLWSTGETTQTILATQSGSYTVTVSNSYGCTATSAAKVVAANPPPAAPSVTANGPTTFCAGGSVTLTSSNAASYHWSNGATTQSITVGAGGSYFVIITDANGCSNSSAPTDVIVNPLPVATITAGRPTTFCAGGSVTLTAGVGSSYSWSTGATTQSITVNSGGNYTVTVTNANGCSATSAATGVTVNALPAPTISAGGPTTFCAGGSVTLTASAGSSYAWSNGATTQSISVNAGGNYSVTVTDANGCSATSASTAVTVNALPAATITPSGATTFCAGGSVTLTASAGSSYSWSTGATTQSIAASSSGNYTVTVTNANGCSATSAATAVTVNPLPAATITPSGATTFCAGGSVTLTASAGSSYAWSNGATTQSIIVSATGNYSVIVTNANGCSATSAATAVTVNPLPAATITPNGATTFCAGGSVTLTASAGASYAWSNGATTQSIIVSASGNYSVTVTNANGCSAMSAPTAVTVNALPAPTISAGGPTTFCAGGSVTLTASAGASYSWSMGATTQSIVVSSTGNYSVIVTGANGCSATSAATAVTVNPLPAATITPSGPTTFCAGGSVTLTASAGASYSWSTGATTQSIVVSSSGNYSVIVTGANGCSATSAATAVTVNPLPAATITPSGATTFCAGGSVTLTASAGSSYSWSNGATTQSIVVSSTGNYTVIVTANGCSRTSAATAVTVTARPTAAVSGNATICAGSSTTISATLSGVGPFAVTWSDGATQNVSGTTASRSVSPSATTTYTIASVSDANCSGTATGGATITVNTLPSFTQPANKTIPKNTSTTLTVNPSGTAPFTYQWYKGSYPSTATLVATTQSYTTPNLSKGTYTYWVRVTNSCGATSSATITVTAN